MHCLRSLVVAGVFSLSISILPRHQHCNQQKEKPRLHLSGGLGRLTSLPHTLQNLLTVLIELELGDDDLGGVDAEGNALAVGLLAGNTLDMHTPLETVDAGDLALAALVGTAEDGDFVVLANGDGADLRALDLLYYIFDRPPHLFVSCRAW